MHQTSALTLAVPSPKDWLPCKTTNYMQKHMTGCQKHPYGTQNHQLSQPSYDKSLIASPKIAANYLSHTVTCPSQQPLATMQPCNNLSQRYST
jgi:hypothetical protein